MSDEKARSGDLPGGAAMLTGIGVRIWYVNKDREEIETKIYPMGEMVPFEDDFFYRSDEIRDYYSIRVNSAVVMPAEEYVKTQGLTMEEVWPDGIMVTDILAVEVTIRNSNDKNATPEEDTQFVDMLNIQILSQGDNYQRSDELFGKMYPKLDQSTFGFRVAPGTEHTLTIPLQYWTGSVPTARKSNTRRTICCCLCTPPKK